MIIWKQGYCTSCAKNKITKYGLLCDACAVPYADIVGDNESHYMREYNHEE